jgi:hypothetical protein
VVSVPLMAWFLGYFNHGLVPYTGSIMIISPLSVDSLEQNVRTDFTPFIFSDTARLSMNCFESW